MKKVLTIAGSDSCGGAGIQADIKTMSAMGVYGMSVITVVTAQNTLGVSGVFEMPKDIVEEQLKAIFEDIEVDSVKIGMLSGIEIIKTVTDSLKKYKAENIVIDPVMLSKNKYKLLKEEAFAEMQRFIGIGTLVTPNIPEAEVLASMKINNEEDIIEAAKRIQKFGVKNVLVKGGHREDNCTDILLMENGEIIKYFGTRIDAVNTHGTGCTLSSAIASLLAKGNSIEESVRGGKEYITQAIKDSFSIGSGVGPLGHFIDIYKKTGIDFE